MNRYRSYSEGDDQPTAVGDDQFLGVDEYSAQENIKPGNVYQAVNMDFQSQDVQTRGGFVCLPELGATPFGMEWTESAYPSPIADLIDCTFGLNQFVAIGLSGQAATSINGTTWTSRSLGSVNFNGNSVSFNGNCFVATGTNNSADPAVRLIARSTNGSTWSFPSSAPVGGSNYLTSVAYGNGKWIAVGYDSSLVGQKSISTDNGLTWTTTTGVSELFSAQSITFGNGLFVVCKYTGSIVTSKDGNTWTTISIPISANWTKVVFGNNVFVALGEFGEIVTSPDAVNWTQTRVGAVSGENWGKNITFCDGIFVALSGVGQKMLRSINGTGWIEQSFPVSNGYKGVSCGEGIFLAVGSTTFTYTYSIPQSVYASSIYSDPNSIGITWTMLVGSSKVGFYAFGEDSRSVSLGGYVVNQQSTIVQCNNLVYLFRGADQQPLYWDGDWDHSFELVPLTTPAPGFETIPYSNQATYYQNRLWVINGKDTVSASDVLDFNTYDQIANEFNINTGDSDYLVATFPFGQNSLLAFKHKSILNLQQVDGALTDVTVTEVTRQVGLVGINAIVSVGPDLAYVSDKNINLITLTSTNNAVQHKTLPLSAKIQRIMRRVNWQYGYKISMGYLDNHLYIALPLDNSPFCNAVVVYNFITENWYGEWNFDASMNMCIQGWQVADYLGLQRMQAVTEDGRIFIVNEGRNDISGSTVAEISTQLITRAYAANNMNHYQRRLFIDMATNRPKFSVSVFTEGVSEETEVLSDQTYSRSQSWKFNDTPYDLTNANDDYNRAYRKDYATGPDSVQCGSGFLPEIAQELRLPIIARRQGRLSWLQVTNTQGYITIMSAGLETRPGQRSNLIQV
jgi:hypothetical protein